jgi:UDP-N-acetylglucosamine 2-epimerase (non-hydrolysing)
MGKINKILVVFGTRPEAIKMASVIKELKKSFHVKVCVTAQHRQMLDQVLSLFEIKPDHDLNLMTQNQDLYGLSNNILREVKTVLQVEEPDLVLTHGDTTTTFMASLAAFYSQIPVGHVEAGLRTNEIYSPFPEEMNRQLASRLSKFHFCPTERSKDNLIKENIEEQYIYVTGNTVIDSMFSVLGKARDLDFEKEVLKEAPILKDQEEQKRGRLILVTGHRRESFGEGFKNICSSLKLLARRNPEISIIYPVHLNPNVKDPVNKELGKIRNIYLTKPLEYLPFLKLLDLCSFVLTDSGGIQEEAPSLGKPVLVMRENTERPEAVEAGTVKLVGTNVDEIVSSSESLLFNQEIYTMMSKSHNPYGDGNASSRISKIIKDFNN